MDKYVVVVYCFHEDVLGLAFVDAASLEQAAINGLPKAYGYGHDIAAELEGMTYLEMKEFLYNCDAHLNVKKVPN